MITGAVSLLQPGTGTAVTSTTVAADDTGRFQWEGLPVGTYDLLFKGRHTLSARKNAVSLGSAPALVNFGLLREGDANGDNTVTIQDFSLVRQSFGLCRGSGGYDERANFNGDSCIGILDFSLLRDNFGLAGG